MDTYKTPEIDDYSSDVPEVQGRSGAAIFFVVVYIFVFGIVSVGMEIPDPGGCINYSGIA